MRALAAFVRLSRPLFLYGGFAGVALGAAIAAWSGARLDVATYAGVQLMVTAFQLMVHYANDYFDRAGDAAAHRTPWSGGSGVLGETFAPRIALFASFACAAVGSVVAAGFAAHGNPAVALLGALIFILAWCYSSPPVRFAARGLGELDTMVVVAVLVPCAGYAAFRGNVDFALWRALVGPAAAMFAMMLAVELPDAGSDRAAGKRTLVVRAGPSTSWTMIALVGGAAALAAAAQAFKVDGWRGAACLTPALLAAFALVRAARGDPRPATVAFRGVALYAAVVTGLAIAYAVAPAR